MLQQQPWLPQILRARLPKHIPFEFRYDYRSSRHQRDRRQAYSTISPADFKRRFHASSGHATGAKRQVPSIADDKRTKNSEPWINPNSLSDSLEAHRTANRIGLARDGIPIKILGSTQRDRTKAHSHDNRWTGVKVLRLANADAQQHKIKHGGMCPPLLPEWRDAGSIPPQLRLPWLSRIDTSASGKHTSLARERLEAEVRACEQYFSPSLSEQDAALKAFAQIQGIILQGLEANVRVDLTGSREAGIDGPISDLDINVRVPASVYNMDNFESTKDQLQAVENYMRRPNFRNEVVLHAYLKKAHVPIIIGTHSPSGLEFQIQCTTNVYDSLEVSKAFVAEYPTACVVFKIVKQMLSMRGLTQGVFGGITSYPLLNMVVASLKIAGSHIAADDAASQLLLFLDFWSEFSFDRHRIVLTSEESTKANASHTQSVVDPISAIPRVRSKDVTNEPNNYMMSLEDPADPSNDLGRGAHSIKHIQACFIEARHSIWQAMQEWETQPQDSVKGAEQSLFAWCLGGDYTSYEEARWQLDRYHSQELKF